MKTPAVFFPVALALGAIILAPLSGAKAQDTREGPIEIEKCQTISKPGSYRLVNNLTATPGASCLDIQVSFVTIDLGGFTISGPASSFAGITSSAVLPRLQGLAIRNGSISGFNVGLDLFGDGSIVEGLRIAQSQTIGMENVTGIVRGNTITNIGAGNGTGITASGIITGNVSSFNGAGFIIGQGSTVTGNTVTNNGSDGLSIDHSSTVIGNTAANNGGIGLDLFCPSNVTDNTAVNNGANLVLSGGGCNNTNNVAP
jgi:hypothetical protein